jgi:hypothetical protein
MKGDFTRDTFDPARQFSRVLMQQGRLQLDADANEQTAILLHYLRTLARDLLGPHAGPADDLGFEIVTRDSVPPAELDEKLESFEPDARRRRVLADAVGAGDAVIGPGRYYVGGVLVENPRALLYTEQVGYPFNGATTLASLERWDRGLLAYLDVWERHLTSVEDSDIRDAALGGVDTCTRARVVWQVKMLLQPPGAERFDGDAVAGLLPLGTGRLRARAQPAYGRAENQLYRVEVHRAGAATADETGATFKWSRDNGSVVFAVRSLANGTAVLEHLGRDPRRSLEPGDWVEVVDDTIALGEQAGPLAQVRAVDPDGRRVDLAAPGGPGSLPSYDERETPARHPLLRRWDHRADLSSGPLAGALRVTEDAWLDLEDGVQVWFACDGQYRVGDYWMIPARAATRDVDWPEEPGADGNAAGAARPPRGPRHDYAPLMLSTVSRGRRRTTDCRRRIAHASR